MAAPMDSTRRVRRGGEERDRLCRGEQSSEAGRSFEGIAILSIAIGGCSWLEGEERGDWLKCYDDSRMCRRRLAVSPWRLGTGGRGTS